MINIIIKSQTFYHIPTTPQSKREVHKRLEWFGNHQKKLEVSLWKRCQQSGDKKEHEGRVSGHARHFPERSDCPSQYV